MNFTRAFIAVGCLLGMVAHAGPLARATESPTGEAMYSCLSSKGEPLAVWVDRGKQVLSVSAVSDMHPMPQFTQPLLVKAVPSSAMFMEAKPGYFIKPEGPSYDQDFVLMIGSARMSCVKNYDD